ncbi:hypothetical protein N7486_005280 [Penicillium sp. IBT 16267x]|nr:hypothetical protein N7486_005280 [Penicillium sp. IBT 16267x]
MLDIVTDCLAQLDLDCAEEHTPDSTKIDLLAALPSHKEIIIELIQAFRTGITSDDITPEISAITNKSKTNQKPPGISKPAPALNHSDSKTDLWRANMSSVSSPDFRDHNADKWFSDFELASLGTKANIGTVEYGATAEFLDLSNDEDGGSSNAVDALAALSALSALS